MYRRKDAPDELIAAYQNITYFPDDLDLTTVPAETIRRVFQDDLNASRFLEPFRNAFLSPQFPRAKLHSEITKPVYLHGYRMGHTAAVALWTMFQVTGREQNGIDLAAITLMLSGISKEADEESIAFFSTLMPAESGEMIRDIRDVKKPVAVHVYNTPEVVLETCVVAAAASISTAFFAVLGAGQ